jgi:hypothetical protein
MMTLFLALKMFDSHLLSSSEEGEYLESNENCWIVMGMVGKQWGWLDSNGSGWKATMENGWTWRKVVG